MNRPTNKPIVVIRYCVGCRWMIRAAWYAQEILTTFEDQIGQVALSPAHEGGHFSISLDGETLFLRAEDGFIQAKEIKRLIRDKIAPEQALGHIDE